MKEGIVDYLGKLKKKQFQGLLQAAIRYNNIKNPDIETDTRLQDLFDHVCFFTNKINDNRQRADMKRDFRLNEGEFVKEIIDYACMKVNLKRDE